LKEKTEKHQSKRPFFTHRRNKRRKKKRGKKERSDQMGENKKLDFGREVASHC